MAWAGLLMVLGWPIVAYFLAARSQGGGVPARAWTLVNVLVGVLSWSMLSWPATAGLEAPLRLVLFGMGLGLAPMTSQFVVGKSLYANARCNFATRWSRKEFLRLFGSQAVMLTTPPGLALAMLGLGIYAYTSNLHLAQQLPVLVALLVLMWIWFLVWTGLKQTLIPGQIVMFPNQSWKAELFGLSERMGAGLKTCFLAQTTARKTAGAFCLGGGRVGITDTLLSALTLQEFLAVMAHELQHLSHAAQTFRVLLLGMTTTLGAGLIAMKVGSSLNDQVQLLLGLSLMLLAAAASAKLLLNLKRRHEDEADEAAVAYVGPRPMMEALSKVYYLNGVNELTKGTARYRSPISRLERIAHLGHLHRNEAHQILSRIQEAMEADDIIPSARRAS